MKREEVQLDGGTVGCSVSCVNILYIFIYTEQVSRAYLFAICIIHLPHFDIQ